MQTIIKIGYSRFLIKTSDIPVFAEMREVDEKYLNGEAIYIPKDKQTAREILFVEDSQLRLSDDEVNLAYKELYMRSEKECSNEVNRRWALERELKELKESLISKEKVE